MDDLWIGLLIGFATGVPVGVVWEDAYCLIKKAVAERARPKADRPETTNREANPMPWRQPLHRQRLMMFWIVIIFSATQVVIGGFVLWNTTRVANVQENLRDFVGCQARYNQQFAEAYLPVTRANRKTQVALHDFLVSAEPVIGENPTPDDVAEFRTRLHEYLELFDQLEAARDANPFPEPPSDYCEPEKLPGGQ